MNFLPDTPIVRETAIKYAGIGVVIGLLLTWIF